MLLLVLCVNIGCWLLTVHILVLPAPSYFAPEAQGAIGLIEGGIEAIDGPTLPHIFYFSSGGTIGCDEGSSSLFLI